MRSVVVDSSALLASHERDQHAELGRLHATARLLAPALLAYEVAQVVHAKRPDAFGSSRAERADLVATLLSDIELVTPDAPAVARIAELAEREGVSVYDAAFLELAIERSAALLTEDDKLARVAAKRIGKTRVMRMTR
jgi:predicted nucleic acid-binding protein